VNLQRAFAIMRKDIKEAFGNSQIIYALSIVPIIFSVIMPAAFVLGVRFGGTSSINNLDKMFKNMPENIMQQMAGFNEIQQVVYLISVYMFSALFLIIPVMVSMIIAADSFAGEKERKTLEGVLYTPVTDSELIFGKIIASFVPSMIVSWACFALYAVILNVLGMPVFHRIYFPTLNWWVLMLLVVPTISFLSIGVMVLVSARVRGYQEANSMGGMVVLPIIALVAGQASGLMYLSTIIMLLVGLFLLFIDALLFYTISNTFHRDRLVAYIK
jgi:ABC-type transport system involved in multi-copper enzyme maturation permease subunit